YLGDPVAGKTLVGRIIKHTWVKTEDGQYYDFINKVVRKRYRYDEVTSLHSTFSMKSDTSGSAAYITELPEEAEGYYTAEINCTDNSGKEMKFTLYLGRGIVRPYPYTYDYYSLEGDRDKYRLGEKMNLTFKKTEQVLPEGSY